MTKNDTHISHPEPQLVRWGPNDGRPAGIGVQGNTSNEFIPWDSLKPEIEQRLLNQVGLFVPLNSQVELGDLYGRQDWTINIISPEKDFIGYVWFGSNPEKGWGYDGFVRLGKPLKDTGTEVWQTFQRFSDGSYRRSLL